MGHTFPPAATRRDGHTLDKRHNWPVRQRCYRGSDEGLEFVAAARKPSGDGDAAIAARWPGALGQKTAGRCDDHRTIRHEVFR